jgi:Tfp pilus assembly protein PilX
MQPTHASSCLNAHRSSGAILVSSLVLLVIITALALGASRITRMQTVEPTRIQQAIVAFQTAETALAAGERVVRAPDFAPPDVPCSQGRCLVYAPGVVDWAAARRSVDWWREHAWKHSLESGTQPDSTGEMWFVVEELPKGADQAAGRDHYRVTAATLRDGRIRVVLQSVIARGPEANIQRPDDSEDRLNASARQSWRQLY